MLFKIILQFLIFFSVLIDLYSNSEVETLFDSLLIISQSDIKEAKKLTKEILSHPNTKEFPNILANTYLLKSRLFPEDTLIGLEIDEAITLLKLHGSAIDLCRAYQDKGNYYENYEKLDSAEVFYLTCKTCIENSKLDNKNLLLAECDVGLGLLYLKQNRYYDAYNIWNEALHSFYKDEHDLGTASVLNNLGLILFDLGLYNQAIDYFKRSVDQYEKIEDGFGSFAPLANLLSIYSQDSSLCDTVFRQVPLAINKLQNTENNYIIPYMYSSQCHCYLLKNDLDNSWNILTQLDSMYYSNLFEKTYLDNLKGEYFYRSDNIQKSILYSLSAYNALEKEGLTEVASLKQEIFNRLYLSYERTEKKDSANYFLKQLESVHKDVEKNKILFKEAYTSNSLSFNQEVSKLSAFIRTYKLAIISLSIILLILFIVLYYMRYLNNKYKKKFLDEKRNSTNNRKEIDRLDEDNSRLTQSNKRLEKFARVASHDLKSPVSNVIAFSELLQNSIKNESKEKSIQYSETIKKNAKSVYNLINETLKLASISSGQSHLEHTKVEIKSMFESIEDMLGLKIKQKNLSINYLNTLPTLHANRPQLLMLFKNLIENSIKYNNSNPVIINIASKIEDEFIYISVEDNGIGIPQKDLQNVFIEYHRLHSKEKFDGTGLGLAICQEIIKILKGDIIVSSIKGKGSKFTVKLPVTLLMS